MYKVQGQVWRGCLETEYMPSRIYLQPQICRTFRAARVSERALFFPTNCARSLRSCEIFVSWLGSCITATPDANRSAREWIYFSNSDCRKLMFT